MTTKQKKPPQQVSVNMQYELFGQFVSNDVNEVSNTIEIWEGIPKYFFTAKLIEKLRTKSGHADPYKWEYTQNNQNCTVKVHPALIEQADGTYKAFFPSVTEEMIEEALKKIFTDQQYGVHNPNPKDPESWVKFTLRMIHKELKLRGKTRSLSEIKHAIEVMSTCIIVVSTEKKEVWRGAILQDLVTVGRDEYIADTEAYHVARLPLFISHSINCLEYRQFNYYRFMTCNEQLSRWIYKKLINRFRQANLSNNYHFMYLELKKSGLLQQARDIDNRRKVTSALNELIANGVLVDFSCEERKQNRKIVDMKYTVFPSSEFVAEQKAANKRAATNQEKIERAEYNLVEKL